MTFAEPMSPLVENLMPSFVTEMDTAHAPDLLQAADSAGTHSSQQATPLCWVPVSVGADRAWALTGLLHLPNTLLAT